MESGQNVVVIYIRFAKAFNKVDYPVTMKKRKGMRICGKLGRWLHASLTNRKQAVVLWYEEYASRCQVRSTTGVCSRPALVSGTHCWHRQRDSHCICLKFCGWHLSSKCHLDQTSVPYKLISVPYIIVQMKTIWNSKTQSLNVNDTAAIMTWKHVLAAMRNQENILLKSIMRKTWELHCW